MVGSGNPPTTPLLLGLFSLVTLWAAGLAAQTGKLTVLGTAWYKKQDPTFADCLAAVRRVLWAEEAVSPILWRDDYPTWRARARRTTSKGEDQLLGTPWPREGADCGDRCGGDGLLHGQMLQALAHLVTLIEGGEDGSLSRRFMQIFAFHAHLSSQVIPRQRRSW